MLNDEVVAAIDKIAHRQNLTRSALVNRVLAEYASVLTPEQRISDIFSYMERFFDDTGDIVPQMMSNQQTMSLKSSLDYKYRPTVRYEVELERNAGESIGSISVIFRTQSGELLSDMITFFRLWKKLEDTYLPKVKGTAAGENDVTYELYDNRFIRTISLPKDRNYTSDSIADAISSYIDMFDRIMKEYLSGRMTVEDVERTYLKYLEKGTGII